MKLFKTFVSWFTKPETTTNQNTIPYCEGEIFDVEVTTQEAIDSDGSLEIFLNNLAGKFGFDIAEMYPSEFHMDFKVYNPESGECHLVELCDGNIHMIDYLGDVLNGVIKISSFTINLRYVGVC